ncbi:hypothetical protein I6J18_00135 (plasmid) [Peribacillus psychrosaccharolyticus]|uniref:Lipoprotein n=1 Tax=Peribacillus psychrosaccharolyticus TaxID=1407 RepID=A0A974RYG3_PERPY|nr:hypothetical protein [Peribacillus psychrosaccharolyticus]MEC2054246.1 hypothetical protein [Peribacillus psychrosaccharolyticus]MED3742186.1 hypothetical protein [Peribacillus psychrosaccharolyticus]QQS98451.1 hypothetical protein I6J18_00135 [Peribacillus psychrosaccharolyticus]
MKKLFFIFCIISVLLIACSKGVNENGNGNTKKDEEVYLVFEGKNKNWDVQIMFDRSVDKLESTSHVIKYIGKDPNPEKIYYKLGTIDAYVELIDGVWEAGGGECECYTNPDENIMFTVEWDGKKEEFKLKHKEK